MLLKSIFPDQGRFFELFDQAADLAAQAAEEFKKMLHDLSQAETHMRIIKDLEHKADETAHEGIKALHKTFVTPIDRDDIHKLITKIDDVTDFIDAVSHRIVLYDMRSVTPATTTLAEIVVASTREVRKAVNELRHLKDPSRIIRHCAEINRLENEADDVMRSAVAKLFREERDERQLIKQKEVYEFLETVTDRCEDVANVIEGIVLENS